MSLTELEVAERIRDGTIPSPFPFSNMWLVNLRITGTGAAYRSSLDEHVWRNPDFYLNDKFLARCNGLSVIVDHPNSKTMTDDEFKDRIVGSVMLPYIKDNEVWGISRIYSQDIVNEIIKGTVSTSPSVVFNADSGNIVLDVNDEKLLIEGNPFLVDHIALVTEKGGTLGVWDVNKIPEGVKNDLGNDDMSEELKQILEEMKASNAKQDALMARMDAMEKERKDEKEAQAAEKARADAEAEEKAEQERKDAEAAEQARKDAEAAEAEEQARKDAEAAAQKEKEEKADSQEDEEKYADAQAMADNAYSCFGKTARRPMSGETVMDYRKRMVKGLQAHSPTHKDIDIYAIADSALLSVVEKQIYADAAAAASSPSNIPVGTLIKHVRSDDAGRRINEYKGDINAWLAPFKAEPQQVTKFNTMGSNR